MSEEMTKIYIDFEKCYESYPCQHNVTYYGENDEILGTYLTGAREICDMLTSEKCEHNCTVNDFSHFSYLNFPNYNTFMNKLKEKFHSVDEKQNKVAISCCPKLLSKIKNNDPEITLSLKMSQRVIPFQIVKHAIDFDGNNFILNVNKFKSEYCVINKGDFLLTELFFTKNNKMHIPEYVDIYIDNVLVKTWYSDVMCEESSKEKYTLENVPMHYVDNIHVKIHENCDDVQVTFGFIHCEIYNNNNNNIPKKCEDTTHELLFDENSNSNFIRVCGNGYFSKFIICSEHYMKNVSMYIDYENNNKFTLLDKVPTCILTESSSQKRVSHSLVYFKNNVPLSGISLNEKNTLCICLDLFGYNMLPCKIKVYGIKSTLIEYQKN
jgi:hypothetical protein